MAEPVKWQLQDGRTVGFSVHPTQPPMQRVLGSFPLRLSRPPPSIYSWSLQCVEVYLQAIYRPSWRSAHLYLTTGVCNRSKRVIPVPTGFTHAAAWTERNCAFRCTGSTLSHKNDRIWVCTPLERCYDVHAHSARPPRPLNTISLQCCRAERLMWSFRDDSPWGWTRTATESRS